MEDSDWLPGARTTTTMMCRHDQMVIWRTNANTLPLRVTGAIEHQALPGMTNERRLLAHTPADERGRHTPHLQVDVLLPLLLYTRKYCLLFSSCPHLFHLPPSLPHIPMLPLFPPPPTCTCLPTSASSACTPFTARARHYCTASATPCLIPHLLPTSTSPSPSPCLSPYRMTYMLGVLEVWRVVEVRDLYHGVAGGRK